MNLYLPMVPGPSVSESTRNEEFTNGSLRTGIVQRIIDDNNVNVDTVAERLRRWTRNPLGSTRVGSSPACVVHFGSCTSILNKVQQPMGIIDR